MGTKISSLPAAGTLTGTEIVVMDQAGNTVTAPSGNMGIWVRTAAEIAAGVTPTNYAYPECLVDRYGTNTTPGTTDMTAAINAAVSVAAQGAGPVRFLPSTYAHATTLVWQNGIVYQGSGINKTKLLYTGTSDQIQVNNPINSSTLANYDVRDMWLESQTATAGKANFADVGSTLIFFRRVRFSGAMINLILDQSESVRVENCIFQDVVGNSSATAVWMVNGSEHTAGANAGYTNEIVFWGCQFNSAGQSNLPNLVADDGGNSHKLIACNFNAGLAHVRCTGGDGVAIVMCEMEGCTSGCIDTYLTKWGGNAGGESSNIEMSNCVCDTSANPCVRTSIASSVASLVLRNNLFITTSTVLSGVNAGVVFNLAAEGNIQGSTGDNTNLINNVFATGIDYSCVWSGATTNPAIGNGTIDAEYSRHGKTILVSIDIEAASTTTFGSGAWSLSLPVAAENSSFQYFGAVYALVASDNPSALAVIAPGASSCQIYSTGGTSGTEWGATVPGAWASGDFVRVQMQYKAANWIN